MSTTYYLVIGRFCGDDEDTPLIIESDCDDISEVLRMYRQQMHELYPTPEGDQPELFVNYVFSSDTPITVNWNRFGG